MAGLETASVQVSEYCVTGSLATSQGHSARWVVTLKQLCKIAVEIDLQATVWSAVNVSRCQKVVYEEDTCGWPIDEKPVSLYWFN